MSNQENRECEHKVIKTDHSGWFCDNCKVRNPISPLPPQKEEWWEKGVEEKFKELWLKSFVGIATADMGYEELKSFISSRIARERERTLNEVFEKMRPYTIKAKESERIADFKLEQFKSLFTLTPKDNE